MPDPAAGLDAGLPGAIAADAAAPDRDASFPHDRLRSLRAAGRASPGP